MMRGIFSKLVRVSVLTSHNGNMQNVLFRNGFYFRDWNNSLQTMTVMISGIDYVLYSVSNVSLNIILRDIYSHTESNNG